MASWTDDVGGAALSLGSSALKSVLGDDNGAAAKEAAVNAQLAKQNAAQAASWQKMAMYAVVGIVAVALIFGGISLFKKKG